MDVEIREYREEDRLALVRLMEELQDHLVSIDTLGKLRRLPEYGREYSEQTFQKIRENKGKIYVAERQGQIIGCVIGIVETQKSLASEFVPTMQGRILELVVSAAARGKGVGAGLMKKMEEYLKGEGCELLRVEAMAANGGARAFYEKQGYGERMIDFIKKI